MNETLNIVQKAALKSRPSLKSASLPETILLRDRSVFIRHLLRPLVETGLVKRVGTKRSGRYILA